MFFLNVIGNRKEILISFLNLFNDAINNCDATAPIIIEQGIWESVEGSVMALFDAVPQHLATGVEGTKETLSQYSQSVYNSYRSSEQSCLGIRDWNKISILPVCVFSVSCPTKSTSE
jgi:hypothetical protein